MNIKSLKDSNEYIIQLLNKSEPFIISRLGIGAETFLSFSYEIGKKLNRGQILTLENNAGIYNVKTTIHRFCNLYLECIKKSNALACFHSTAYSKLVENEQNYFVNNFKLEALDYSILEPLSCVLNNLTPWSHFLINKKVLIISPFVDSIKLQIDNKFQMFKHQPLFLDGQQFVFYKSFQTSAGNKIHKDWYETYTIMCNDIKDIDFDIALLGCGGYGLPLCNFIHSLGKSAIYIGGSLQILFGVMGKRWENSETLKKIITENNAIFIRPSGNEIIHNLSKIEGGCYW